MTISSNVDISRVYSVELHLFSPGDSLYTYPAVDSSKSTRGIFFFMAINSFGGVAEAYLRFQHSDFSDESGLEYVENKNLIYGRDDGMIPYVDSLTFNDSYLACEGLIGTKRYIYPTVEVKNVTVGCSIFVVAVMSPLGNPTARDGQWAEIPV
jgi:hypothetical protein